MLMLVPPLRFESPSASRPRYPLSGPKDAAAIRPCPRAPDPSRQVERPGRGVLYSASDLEVQPWTQGEGAAFPLFCDQMLDSARRPERSGGVRSGSEA